MYFEQGIFQHHFQYKKVHTILDRIRYFPSASILTDHFAIALFEFHNKSRAPQANHFSDIFFFILRFFWHKDKGIKSFRTPLSRTDSVKEL